MESSREGPGRSKIDEKLNPSLSWAAYGSQETPKSAQETPKRHQRGTQERPKAAQERPRAAQQSPKRCPRTPQSLPKSSPGTPETGFWHVFHEHCVSQGPRTEFRSFFLSCCDVTRKLQRRFFCTHAVFYEVFTMLSMQACSRADAWKNDDVEPPKGSPEGQKSTPEPSGGRKNHSRDGRERQQMQ